LIGRASADGYSQGTCSFQLFEREGLDPLADKAWAPEQGGADAVLSVTFNASTSIHLGHSEAGHEMSLYALKEKKELQNTQKQPRGRSLKKRNPWASDK